jgi:hypothetical protein
MKYEPYGESGWMGHMPYYAGLLIAGVVGAWGTSGWVRWGVITLTVALVVFIAWGLLRKE